MRILVVDDSSMMRRIIRKELEQGDFEIFEASNGEEALNIITEVQPVLVTLDVHMPKMDGYGVCETIRHWAEDSNDSKIKEKLSKIPIIFVTANDTLEGRSQGFQVGGSDFIRKPFLSGEILATASKMLKPASRLTGLTALVVDDSTIARNIVVGCLKEQGVSIIEAVDGVPGYEILTKQRDHIDLVITDFFMKEMHGDEFCRKVRNELGLTSMPILVLSAMSEKHSVLDLFKAGATDYLMKPFVKEELVARINVHLEVRLLNSELNNKVNDLKGLNKLKDEFLAIASHDLRSPLNGIMGATDLLMEKDYFTQEDKKWLKHIQDSGGFLLYLINDILDLSRLQSENDELSKTIFSLEQIATSSINTLAHTAFPKSIKIELTNNFGDIPIVSADKNGMTRIFNNLLSNAIKFTPKDGKISVIIELDGKMVAVSIKDTGIGIAEDKIPLLFEKFSKTSQSGTAGEKGTGLGLSITKELVERHDGKIEVTSEVGKGTCFRFCLPAGSEEEKKKFKEKTEKNSKSSPNASSEEKSKPEEKRESPIRLLLVEDNAMNIKLAKTMFLKKGYEVVIAENGQIAVDKVKQVLEETKGDMEKSPFEFILMDIQMPILNGLDAAIQIRDLEASYGEEVYFPIVAMSAHSSPIEIERCEEIGMDGYIMKPVKMSEVSKMIDEVLSKKNSYSFSLTASKNED